MRASAWRGMALIPLLASLLATTAALAHDVRPAYLELRETRDRPGLEVFWKVPAGPGGRRPLLAIAWPAGTIESRDAPGRFEADAWVERFRVDRPGGWTGTSVAVRGMENGLSDVLVRLEHRDGTSRTARLTGAAPEFAFEAARGGGVAATYTRLGAEHILFGVDHLLFVLALLLLTDGAWRLVRTITAFTLAHSITLALATLGVVRVPQAPVEATIALSIVFAAAEVIRRRRDGAAGIDPWVIAFAFGLLHGFGFAGALREVGLPQGAIVPALFFFNAGVEAGQLLFIAAVLLLIAALRRLPLPRPAWGWRVVPYAIGTVAAFWLMERIAAL
jgi:hydrogenase/urease accessory protein HupE